MIDILNAQSKAAELLASFASSTSIAVIADDGKHKTDKERALTQDGFCIVISRPQSTQMQVNAGGVSFGSCNLTLQLIENPERNPQPGGLDVSMLTAMQQVTSALQAYDSDAGCRYFRFTNSEMRTDDPSELVYELTFDCPLAGL